MCPASLVTLGVRYARVALFFLLVKPRDIYLLAPRADHFVGDTEYVDVREDGDQQDVQGWPGCLEAYRES